MSLPPFDLENCTVLIEVDPRPLRPKFPRDGLLSARARVVPLDPETGEALADTPYATLDWTRAAFVEAAERSVFHFEVSGQREDLSNLDSVLFDDEDDVREELGLLRTFGDLLVIDRLQVEEGQPFHAIAEALLEHVLAHFVEGCFAVAYIDDLPPDPDLQRVLLRRGFKRFPQEKDEWSFFLLDLGRKPTRNPKNAPDLN